MNLIPDPNAKPGLYTAGRDFESMVPQDIHPDDFKYGRVPTAETKAEYYELVDRLELDGWEVDQNSNRAIWDKDGLFYSFTIPVKGGVC